MFILYKQELVLEQHVCHKAALQPCEWRCATPLGARRVLQIKNHSGSEVTCRAQGSTVQY
jgi:hypothetical protein